MRESGIDRDVISSVLGHSTGNISMDVYAPTGAGMKLLRKAVATVSLPVD